MSISAISSLGNQSDADDEVEPPLSLPATPLMDAETPDWLDLNPPETVLGPITEPGPSHTLPTQTMAGISPQAEPPVAVQVYRSHWVAYITVRRWISSNFNFLQALLSEITSNLHSFNVARVASQREAQEHSRQLEALSGELSAFRRASSSHWRDVDNWFQDLRDQVSNQSRRQQRVLEDLSRKMDEIRVEVQTLRADVDRIAAIDASSNASAPEAIHPALSAVLQAVPGLQDTLLSLVREDLQQRLLAHQSPTPRSTQPMTQHDGANDDDDPMMEENVPSHLNDQDEDEHNTVITPNDHLDNDDGHDEQDEDQPDLARPSPAPSTDLAQRNTGRDPARTIEPVPPVPIDSAVEVTEYGGSQDVTHQYINYDSSGDEDGAQVMSYDPIGM